MSVIRKNKETPKSQNMESSADPKIVLGWREWASLPDLNIPLIKAKIDTGARTSSLHAHDIITLRKINKDYVKFKVFPLRNRTEPEIECEAEILDQRMVRSSNGEEEERYFISTTLQVGEHAWPIEITLSDRSDMKFRMLLGRTALRSIAIIDVETSYVQGRRSYRKAYSIKSRKNR